MISRRFGSPVVILFRGKERGLMKRLEIEPVNRKTFKQERFTSISTIYKAIQLVEIVFHPGDRETREDICRNLFPGPYVYFAVRSREKENGWGLSSAALTVLL